MENFQDILIVFVEPITVVGLLAIGIPLWVIGASKNKKSFYPILLSLPLLTNDSFPSNKYYITQKVQSTFVNSINLSIPVNNKLFKQNKIYLLHNMWGFSINSKLIANGQVLNTVQIQQNSNSLQYNNVQRYPILKIPEIKSIKKIQVNDNYFNVYCPYPTEITEVNNIQPLCQESSYPMKFEGRYSINSFFPPINSKSFSEITLNFDRSYFIPYNYIDTPETYVFFYKNANNKAMHISGIVITSIGIAALVGYLIFDCVVFVSFFADED